MPPTLLAIDDSVDVLMSIGAVLGDDYDLRVATAGEDGLALAAGSRPELILLDVMMPGLDGFETLRRLQADARLRTIPVIFLSALDRPEDEARCFEAGGVDFVAKPFNPTVLRARIATQIRLKQQADLLRSLALRDGLTGLYNRRHCNEVLEREWRSGQRAGQPLSLLLLDVDHFKTYNDSNGHQAGDDCLIAIGAALQAQMQRGRDCVGRYGGEEFLGLLPATRLADATLVAERIRLAVEALALPHPASDTAGVVTVSIGVATDCEFDAPGPDRLLRRADQQLYKAKAAGRNRVSPDPTSH